MEVKPSNNQIAKCDAGSPDHEKHPQSRVVIHGRGQGGCGSASSSLSNCVAGPQSESPLVASKRGEVVRGGTAQDGLAGFWRPTASAGPIDSAGESRTRGPVAPAGPAVNAHSLARPLGNPAAPGRGMEKQAGRFGSARHRETCIRCRNAAQRLHVSARVAGRRPGQSRTPGLGGDVPGGGARRRGA